MSIQKTAIFYIILIFGEFSNGTSFHGEDIPPAASINSLPTSNEVELSSVNNDSYNTNPSSYWNTYTVVGLVSGAVIPIIGLHVLWKPVNYKREYASVENLAANVMGVSKLGIAITTYMILGSVSGSCVPTLDNEYCNSSYGILASASPDSNNSTEPINNSSWDKFKLSWNKFTLWGAVAGAVVLTPSILCIPPCLGFARSGIAPMSCAANMMSRSAIASGGGVVVGSLVAILQSIGALGVCSLGFIPIGIIIMIGASIGFGIGYGVKMINDSYNPGINDSYNPGINDSYNPGINDSYNPGINHSYNPGINDSYNPGINHSYNPGINDTYNPGINLDGHGQGENTLVIYLIGGGIALFTFLCLVCVCCCCRRSRRSNSDNYYSLQNLS